MVTVSSVSLKGILKDVSFSAEQGEIIGIIGPGGSGKTSLLEIIAGKKKQDHGRVIIGKLPVESYTQKELTAKVFLFDRSQSVNTEDTVENFIMLSRAGYKKLFMPFNDYDNQITQEYLRKFGLYEKRHQRLKDLSQNDLQAAFHAHVFSSEADIILFDNPTGYLDLKKTTIFEKSIARYALSGEKTVIIATNDINHVTRTADRIIVLKDGIIAMQGQPDMITQEMIKEYFGVDVFISRNIYNSRPELHLFPPL